MPNKKFTNLSVYTETAQDIKAWIESRPLKSGVAETIDYLIKLGIKQSLIEDTKVKETKTG